MFGNIVFEGRKRYYIEDLSCRDYMLENTTPYKITLNGVTIEAHAWGLLLCEIVSLLLSIRPKSKEELLSFRCKWSKKPVFALTAKINHKFVKNGIFLNCNHTALHSCWLLQDLLDFFEVEKSATLLLIHRMPKAEPKEVKEELEREFKAGFYDYLLNNHNKTNKEIVEIINIIEFTLNPMLSNSKSGYNNLFLFDEQLAAYNYIKKLYNSVSKTMSIKERTPLLECMELLLDYYKEIG